MKKTILKALSATFFVGLVMSSCLGDNDSKIENSNALAYIKQTEDFRNVAIAGNISFTHDYVKRLEAGEFYHLDYSVYTKDGQSPDGSFIARSVGPVGDGEPLVRGEFYAVARPQPINKVKLYPTQVNLSNLRSPFQEDLNDNWAFTYSCLAYQEDKDLVDKKDNIRLSATILPEDQRTGADSDDLDDNKVVVRLYLERYDDSKTVNTSRDRLSHANEARVNLSSLRYYLRQRIQNIGKDGAVGIIQFKYQLEPKKEGDTPQYQFIGNLSDERPECVMLIKD